MDIYISSSWNVEPPDSGAAAPVAVAAGSGSAAAAAPAVPASTEPLPELPDAVWAQVARHDVTSFVRLGACSRQLRRLLAHDGAMQRDVARASVERADSISGVLAALCRPDARTRLSELPALTVAFADDDIPRRDARALCVTLASHCGALMRLHLDNLPLVADDIAALAPLTGLTALRLASRYLTDEGLDALAALPPLKKLEVASVGLWSADFLAAIDLSALEELTLCRNDVASVPAAAIARLRRLKTLCLTLSDVGGADLGALAAVTSLRSLVIWGTPGTAADLAPLTQLTHLLCDGWQGECGWDPAGAGPQRLNHLRELELCDEHYPPAALAALAPLTALTRLTLREDALDAAALHAYARQRPALTVMLMSADNALRPL